MQTPFARFPAILAAAACLAAAGCASLDPAAILDAIEDAVPAEAVPADVPAADTPAPPAPDAQTDWARLRLATCWDGDNAQRRMMNAASPAMPDDKARQYFAWQVGRGATATHLFAGNKGDGEHAGYSIYGATWDWTTDPEFVGTMERRFAAARASGMAVVLWLMADDSTAWNMLALADPGRYCSDLKASGLLDYADAVVVGLELSEYADEKQVARLVTAARDVFPRDVGTHDVSGSIRFAKLADFAAGQVKPGSSVAQVADNVRKGLATGVRYGLFELDRKPNRKLCEAALAAGSAFVGNW